MAEEITEDQAAILRKLADRLPELRGLWQCWDYHTTFTYWLRNYLRDVADKKAKL